MSNNLLKPLIEKFKKQDMSAFPIVYEEFKKLIGFYSYKLGYDDAIQDLSLHLIETLYNIDLSNFSCEDTLGLKKYIAVSLRNKYISLSIENAKYKRCSDALYENLSSDFQNYDDKVFLLECLDILSDKQKVILIYKFVYGYSDLEIANSLDITRQAVNRIKNRGLLTLRNFLEEELYDK